MGVEKDEERLLEDFVEAFCLAASTETVDRTGPAGT